MNRIYHTWDKWECYPAGFYENNPPGSMAASEAVRAYSEFLSDTARFRAALCKILSEWPNSCEHYLSNENMNRIAWLGQAAMCIETGIPSTFRAGFTRLTRSQQTKANEVALDALNRWLTGRGENAIDTVDSAKSKTKPDLY